MAKTAEQKPNYEIYICENIEIDPLCAECRQQLKAEVCREIEKVLPIYPHDIDCKLGEDCKKCVVADSCVWFNWQQFKENKNPNK